MCRQIVDWRFVLTPPHRVCVLTNDADVNVQVNVDVDVDVEFVVDIEIEIFSLYQIFLCPKSRKEQEQYGR